MKSNYVYYPFFVHRFDEITNIQEPRFSLGVCYSFVYAKAKRNKLGIRSAAGKPRDVIMEMEMKITSVYVGSPTSLPWIKHADG